MSKEAAARKAAEETAEMVIGLISLGVSSALRIDASLSPIEQSLVQPSLTNMIGRMSPKTMERVAGWADPVVLAAGLVMWYTRCNGMVAERRKAELDATAPMNGNGATPQHDGAYGLENLRPGL